MVTRYGMDPGLGHVAYDAPRSPTPEFPLAWNGDARTLSEDTLRRVDAAVAGLVGAGFEVATRWLTAHRDMLERGAQALLEHETLDEAALRALTAGLREIDQRPTTA
jgi:cell division protease FtsH